MVGRPFCLCCIVRAGPEYAQILADHDAVEPGDGTLRVEAGARKDYSVVMQELDKAAAVARPFVEVAHQDCRHFLWALQHRVQDRTHLPFAPKPGQIEMHADNPQILFANAAFNQNRSAGFQRGDDQRPAIEDLDVGANQHRVAMPADALLPGAELHRPQFSVIVEKFRRQGRFPRAETPIRFLKGNDIGTDFVNNRQDSLRAPQSVGTDGLANVVTGNPDHEAALATSSTTAKPERRKAVLIEFQPDGHERTAARVAAGFEVSIVKPDNVVADRDICIVHRRYSDRGSP